MTAFKPFFIILGIIFLIGIVFNLVLPNYIDLTVANPESIFTDSVLFNFLISWINASFIDLIDTGYIIFDIFGFNGFELKIPVLNIFALLGDTVTNFLTSQLIILTYIPNLLLVPFMILFAVATVLFTIKVLLP